MKIEGLDTRKGVAFFCGEMGGQMSRTELAEEARSQNFWRKTLRRLVASSARRVWLGLAIVSLIFGVGGIVWMLYSEIGTDTGPNSSLYLAFVTSEDAPAQP